MRKKSHILLAKWIADQNDYIALHRHKVSFYIGCVLPDCKPSFVTRKHEFEETFEKVAEDIRLLTERENCMDDVFWIKLGEVLHYIADYFTFPHNTVFEGSIWEHGKYEKQLKCRLKEYIRSGRTLDFKLEKRCFSDVQALIEYVKREHRLYMNHRKSLEDDILYIIRVCNMLFLEIIRIQMKKTSGMAA